MEPMIASNWAVKMLAASIVLSCAACDRGSLSKASSAAWPSNAPQTGSNHSVADGNDFILVDFETGAVDGISLRQDGKTLRSRLGAGRVQRTTELLEGDPNELYVVKFGAHTVSRHWNAFSYSDPIFKTADRLGVGSTIADFEKIYGRGHVVEEEGCAIEFQVEAHGVHFAILPCSTGALPEPAVAKEIWVW